MNDACVPCPYERAYDVQLKNLTGDLDELKTRVGALETTLNRGLLLLVANLVGVILTLAQQILGQ